MSFLYSNHGNMSDNAPDTCLVVSFPPLIMFFMSLTRSAATCDMSCLVNIKNNVLLNNSLYKEESPLIIKNQKLKVHHTHEKFLYLPIL